MKYKDLEIWVMARDLVNEIHRMRLTDLPKFEMYEVGSQIRRSIKSGIRYLASGISDLPRNKLSPS